MTNPNGWPNADKPGVPPNPETDGWHWLVPSIDHALPPGAYRWHAPPRPDVIGQWDAGYPQDVVRRGYDYLGPCLTPAEVEAAVKAEREACARVAQDVANEGAGNHYVMAAAIAVRDSILARETPND